MGLVDLARKDAQKFLGNTGDFGVAIKLTSIDVVPVILNLQGYHIKHHTGFDLEGVRLSSKTSSIAVSELDLIANTYPHRIDNEISLKDHLVEVADSSGSTKNYIIRQSYPDEFLGVIVLILGDIS